MTQAMLAAAVHAARVVNLCATQLLNSCGERLCCPCLGAQEPLPKGGIGVVLKTSYDADTFGCSIVRFCHQDSPSHYACVQGKRMSMAVGTPGPYCHAAQTRLTRPIVQNNRSITHYVTHRSLLSCALSYA